jgi:tellurite resistance protein
MAKKNRTAQRAKQTSAAKSRTGRPSTNDTGDTDVAEAVLEALAATVVADGTFSPAEKALLERFSRAPLFEDVADKNLVIKKAIEKCASEGLETVLRKAAARIESSEDREAAFTACFAAAVADGTVGSSELGLIELLRKTFGLSVRRARELTAP